MSAVAELAGGSPSTPLKNYSRAVPADTHKPLTRQKKNQNKKRKKRHGGYFHLYTEDEEKFGHDYILVHNESGERRFFYI